MLRIAQQRLDGSGARLMLQDLRTLRLPHAMDLLLCNGDTLNYLVAPRELLRALRAYRRNLRPGGHLICDLLTGTPPAQRFIRQALTPGGRVVRWRCRTDPSRGMIWVEYAVAHSSSGAKRWVVELHRQRWFPAAGVLQGLAAAHLRPRAILRLDGNRDSRSTWVQVLARAERRRSKQDNDSGD